jgi:hypothetical protein
MPPKVLRAPSPSEAKAREGKGKGKAREGRQGKAGKGREGKGKARARQGKGRARAREGQGKGREGQGNPMRQPQCPQGREPKGNLFQAPVRLKVPKAVRSYHFKILFCLGPVDHVSLKILKRDQKQSFYKKKDICWPKTLLAC